MNINTTCFIVQKDSHHQSFLFVSFAWQIPAAFTKPTGEAHWEILLRARAIECQCYVIAAAQAGMHNEKRQSFGHSCIIDPWGKIIGSLIDPLATGIATAEIDFSVLNKIRQNMPIEEHREAGLAILST